MQALGLGAQPLPALALLARQTIGDGAPTDAPSFDFTDIPQLFGDLVVRGRLRINGASDFSIYCRFNGATTGYYGQVVYKEGDGSDSSGGQSFGLAIFFMSTLGTPQAAGMNAVFQFVIPGYSRSAHRKFMWADSIRKYDTSTNASTQRMLAFFMAGGVPVTRLTLLGGASEPFLAGSMVSIYGMGRR